MGESRAACGEPIGVVGRMITGDKGVGERILKGKAGGFWRQRM